MPNPWDAGSARLLAQLGFPALATTSAGFEWSVGLRDNGPSVEATLEHIRAVAGAVEVPVNADFTNGFAAEPADVAENVRRAVATGIAGLSIEDSSGDGAKPLYDFDLAVERMRAARAAIDESGTGVLLTGRCESFLVGRPDLAETIRRLAAYAEAGAECLYAPCVEKPADIGAIVAAVAPRPVNVLVNGPFTTVDELRALGVRRISVGGALARAAWGGFLRAAREIAERGTFSALGEAVSSSEIEPAFGDGK